MPATYLDAEQDVLKLLARAVRSWHPALARLEFTIRTLMVSPPCNSEGMVTGPALKHAGHPAAAKIHIANPRERCLARCSIILEIDADIWETLTDDQRLALLDHELTHIVVDETASPPRLRTRPDDWCVTGFAEVVERHKQDAMEVRAMKSVGRMCQGVFDFLETPVLVAAQSG